MDDGKSNVIWVVFVVVNGLKLVRFGGVGWVFEVF